VTIDIIGAVITFLIIRPIVKETLIDFKKIPNDIQDDILREFKNVKVGSREGLFDFFIKNRLNNLVDNLGEF
jgi:hypothetical protein